MTDKQRLRISHFNIVHRVAKGFVCFFVVVLLACGRHWPEYALYIETVAVILWFFGTNPIGYVLEKITNRKHQHDVI